MNKKIISLFLYFFILCAVSAYSVFQIKEGDTPESIFPTAPPRNLLKTPASLEGEEAMGVDTSKTEAMPLELKEVLKKTTSASENITHRQTPLKAIPLDIERGELSSSSSTSFVPNKKSSDVNSEVEVEKPKSSQTRITAIVLFSFLVLLFLVIYEWRLK